MAIAGEDSFYVLRYDRDAYVSFIDNGGQLDDEGVEEAFELEADISDVVQTGKWIGDCFVYTTAANRLNYVVGGQTHTITHFDRSVDRCQYLGYVLICFVSQSNVSLGISTRSQSNLPVRQGCQLLRLLPFPLCH